LARLSQRSPADAAEPVAADDFRAREQASSMDARSALRFRARDPFCPRYLGPRAVLHAEPDARHLDPRATAPCDDLPRPLRCGPRRSESVRLSIPCAGGRGAGSTVGSWVWPELGERVRPVSCRAASGGRSRPTWLSGTSASLRRPPRPQPNCAIAPSRATRSGPPPGGVTRGRWTLSRRRLSLRWRWTQGRCERRDHRNELDLGGDLLRTHASTVRGDASAYGIGGSSA
jgi:hypothetical protein